MSRKIACIRVEVVTVGNELEYIKKEEKSSIVAMLKSKSIYVNIY